ncbi:MAG: sigma-70 family RNA polymerase sigma factor [Polyangiales bacterium]
MDGSPTRTVIDLSDPAVFSAMVPTVRRTARAHLRAMGGPPPGHEADDVVQDCLLDLARGASRWVIADEAGLRGLTRTVVERRVRDHRKRARRRRARFAYESELPEGEFPEGELREAADHGEEPSVAPAARPRLRRELSALSSGDRALLAARYGEGESFEAMGAAAGVDPRTVARRHERLIATLRARCARRRADVESAPGSSRCVDGAVGRRWSPPADRTKEVPMKHTIATTSPCAPLSQTSPSPTDPVSLVRAAPWVQPEAVPSVPEGFVAPESNDSLPNVTYVGEVHHAELVLALDEVADGGEQIVADFGEAAGEVSQAPALRDRVKGLRVTIVRLERALSAAKLQLVVAVSDGHHMVKGVEREVRHRAARQPQVLDRYPQVVRYGGLQAQRVAEGLARSRKAKAQAKATEAAPKPADGDKPKG